VALRPFSDEELERSLDRQLMLGLVFGGLVLAGFPLYAWREPGRLERAAATVRQQATAEGKALFALHCQGCHGPEGRGGGPAPTLVARELLGASSDEQLHWLIAGGLPGTTMSAYHLDFGGPLTSQHVSAVVTYLRSLEPEAPSVPDWRRGAVAAAAPPAPPTAPVIPLEDAGPHDSPDAAPEAVEAAPAPAPEADGAQLYAARCAMCHGAKAEGVAGLGTALLVGPAAARTDAARAALIAAGVPGTAMPAFAIERGGPLKAEDIDAVGRWLRGQIP
jgi:mono/diheme cytochrome c family protein